MEQKSLWDDMPEEEPIIPARRIQPLPPAEPTHYHIELWFRDPRRRPVRMCSEEADYHTRYTDDDIWSVGGCGGSLTREGCVICNPLEDEE
jgi:hypothetical protein